MILLITCALIYGVLRKNKGKKTKQFAKLKLIQKLLAVISPEK